MITNGTQKAENHVATNLQDYLTVDQLCEFIDQHGVTQHVFLASLARDILSKNETDEHKANALWRAFQILVIPCIEQVLKVKYPDMPISERVDKKNNFFNGLKTNSHEQEHAEILLMTVEYLLTLLYLNVNVTESNAKNVAELATTLVDFPKKIKEYYISHIPHVRLVIQMYGNEQDVENFDTWVKEHETTGKWNWDFFAKHNLGTIFRKGNDILVKDFKAQCRLENIREARKKIAQQNNPIDKFTANTIRTLISSKTMKYIFWVFVIILVLVINAGVLQ